MGSRRQPTIHSQQQKWRFYQHSWANFARLALARTPVAAIVRTNNALFTTMRVRSIFVTRSFGPYHLPDERDNQAVLPTADRAIVWACLSNPPPRTSHRILRPIRAKIVKFASAHILAGAAPRERQQHWHDAKAPASQLPNQRKRRLRTLPHQGNAPIQ